MDFQLPNWFVSLFKKTDPTVVPDSSSSASTRSAILADLGIKSGLGNKAIDRLESYWSKYFPTSTPRFWAAFDCSVHSRNKRLYIFDLHNKTVAKYYCAHGKNSDPNFTGNCIYFSNTPGSLCTSKGIYKCAETYISGKFGYALRLDGLESTNSNARSRAVVFHGAKYVSDEYVAANGKCGRSEGCTAVDFKYSKDLIDKLKNGSPLIIWEG